MSSSIIINIIFGGIIALLCVYTFRGKNKEREAKRWGYGLIAAALIYLVFSLTQSNTKWILIELAGVVIYFAIFKAAISYTRILLGVGWILHLAWDLFVHIYLNPGYAPSWYPDMCLGFDVVVGIYLLRLVKIYKL